MCILHKESVSFFSVDTFYMHVDACFHVGGTCKVRVAFMGYSHHRIYLVYDNPEALRQMRVEIQIGWTVRT